MIVFIVFVSLWSLCGISLFLSQYGGAIYNEDVVLTFEGSTTFTSCSAESPSPYIYDDVYAVSSGEWLSVEAQVTYGDIYALKIKSNFSCR